MVPLVTILSLATGLLAMLLAMGPPAMLLAMGLLAMLLELVPLAMPHRLLLALPVQVPQGKAQEKVQVQEARAVADRVVAVNPASGVTTELRGSRESVGRCGMLHCDFVLMIVVSVDAVH